MLRYATQKVNFMKIFIPLIFFLSSCTTIARWTSSPEYTIRTDIAHIRTDYSINEEVYIKNNTCYNDICKLVYLKLLEEIKTPNSKVVLSTNPEKAKYIISIENKLYTTLTEDQANVIKNYITYSSLSDKFSFDSNNTPHLTQEQSLLSIMSNSKDLGKDTFYNKKSITSLGVAGIGGFSAFLVPGIMAIPIAGITSIGLGILTYFTIDQFQSIGNVAVFEVKVDVQNNNEIINNSKLLHKKANNAIEEQFYNYKTKYSTFNSSVQTIAMGSKFLSDEIKDNIASFVALSIIQMISG